MASLKPSELLEGETPCLIDEWQDAPALWTAVRFTVDQRKSRGQFILTGSVVPKMAKKHAQWRRPFFKTHNAHNVII